jgi:hypothetical protein
MTLLTDREQEIERMTLHTDFMAGNIVNELLHTILELREANNNAKRWITDPSKGANEIFEDIGDWFNKDTGYMRPGKSYSMYEGPPPEDLQEIWEKWCKDKKKEIYEALDKNSH